MKKIKIILTTWDEGFHKDRVKYFQKRYENIDSNKFEFIPFFYSDYFKSDKLNRVPKELLNSVGIDKLYRNSDIRYLKMIEDFKKLCDKSDIVMFTSFCAIHPNFLYNECNNIVKVLCAIDDPPSSFERTVPYLFAVDVCTFVSLSYNDKIRMEDQLRIWGAKKTYFTPMGASHLNRKDSLKNIDSLSRDIDLIYVGGMYPVKIDRFTKLKKEFGDSFELYGRWSPFGLRGIAYTLLNHKTHDFFRWRVNPLSPSNLAKYYQRTKIGINMHWENAETGNTRLYELPANGVMQICDRGAGNATADLFEEDKEIILYNTINEAIDKIRFYLKNDTLREKIAMAGYKRVMKDYKQEDIQRNLFNWIIKEFNLC